ncbi:MAG TPA: DUF5665 domain-containing protein [Patescibacteria group bacterium]|jgi:hypothetical protein
MAKRKPSRDSATAIEQFALALERGRFIDYIQQLQSTRTLLWKNFLTGLARGFGAIVGATVVVAIVVTILGLLGDNLPGEFGDFFTNTSKQIQPSP